MPAPQVANELPQAGGGICLQRSQAAVPLLLAFCALLYLPQLGVMPLWEPDEPRYAEVAREMVASGDLVTPRCNYVRYFNKPPLLYWMTAGSLALLGTSEFAARLPSTLAAIGGVLVCYLLARSMFGGLAALFAAGVVATSLLYLGLAVIVRFDAPLTFFVSLALLLFWRGHQEADANRAARFFLPMYAALALAVLMKGPVGPVLVGIIILVYLLWTRNLRLLGRMHLPLGLLIFAAIAVPWFVLAERANPGMARFFFVGENISRYASAARGHENPVWYFLPVLLLGMLPWTGLLPAAIAHAIADQRAAEPARANGTLLCMIWAAVTLVFFSLSISKLVPYILPAWPAVAALLGSLLADWAQQSSRSGRQRRVYAASLLALLATVLAMGICSLMFARSKSAPPAEMVAPTAALLAAVAIAALAAVVALCTLRRLTMLVLLTAAMGALMAGLMAGMIAGGAARSLKPLAQRVAAELRPGDLLIAYRCFPRSICFYTGQRLMVVGATPVEFRFDPDSARREGIWVPEADEMRALLRSGTRVLAFAKGERYAELKQQYAGGLYELGRRPGMVLFSNEPPAAARR